MALCSQTGGLHPVLVLPMGWACRACSRLDDWLLGPGGWSWPREAQGMWLSWQECSGALLFYWVDRELSVHYACPLDRHSIPLQVLDRLGGHMVLPTQGQPGHPCLPVACGILPRGVHP